MEINEKNEKNVNSYLIFKLGEEEFAVHVDNVLNILEMTRIVKVPNTPDSMKGVINLRGTVLPVIDIRIKFGLSETQYTSNTCIVVMDLDFEGDTKYVGVIVDKVLSVTELSDNKIVPPPSIGNKINPYFIYGMAELEDDFIMLLEMKKVIFCEDDAHIKDTTDRNNEKQAKEYNHLVKNEEFTDSESVKSNSIGKAFASGK